MGMCDTPLGLPGGVDLFLEVGLFAEQRLCSLGNGVVPCGVLWATAWFPGEGKKASNSQGKRGRREE